MRAGFMRSAAAIAAALLAFNVLPVVGTALAACAGFCLVENFDSLDNGNINGQGTWSGNPPGAEDGAIVTSFPPPAFSGKTMRNNPDGVQYRGNAYNPLGDNAIVNGTTGTMFFQIYIDDLAASDFSVGLSDIASPVLAGADVSFANYEAQITFRPEGLRIRNGSTTQNASNVTVQSDTLYSIWIVANNTADTYEVYIEGGNITSQTKVQTSGGSVFGFRNGSATNSLITYLQQNTPSTPYPTSDAFVDNIYIDPDTVNLNYPAPRFLPVESFNGLASGALNGKNGWTASSSNITVAADPLNASNNVMRLAGADIYAHKAISPLNQGQTGTLFFRIRRDGLVNSSLGLSDSAAPATFGDFETQINIQNSSTLNVRDAGAFDAIDIFPEDTWFCVWLIVNNAADTYEVYIEGGDVAVPTRVAAGSQTSFAFRNGTASNALARFFTRNGNPSTGVFFIDDIYVEPDQVNFGNPVPGADCESDSSALTPLSDPIPETIEKSGLEVELEPFVVIPASSTGNPKTRINFLTHANDGSGRLFVNDLRNRLYVIENGNVSVYLDVKAQFPDFVDSPRLGTGFGFFAFHPEFATNGKFYTVHTEAGSALSGETPDYVSPEGTDVHGIVTEWTTGNPTANTFSGTRREVLRIGFETFLHGFQQIGFNTNARPGDEDYGLLYITAGDGEENPNFSDGPQDLSVPHGKILRIDPLASNGPNGQYGIPSSNPFVGVSGALGEIWAYGFRNPHRFSWDEGGSGRMFIGNIGEKQIDAIYLGGAGNNYGWNEREGGFLFLKTDPNFVYPLPPNDAQYGYVYPVAQYDHDEGRAVVGGFVYRGDAIPELYGKYVFGDIVNGRIFYIDEDDMVQGQYATIHELTLLNQGGSEVTLLGLVGGGRTDLRLGIDAEGEIYILSKTSGDIWKLVSPSNQPATCGAYDTNLSNVIADGNWNYLTPSRWDIADRELIMTTPASGTTNPIRPKEFAILTEGPVFVDFTLNAQVKIDTPTSDNGRDVVIVFGYQSDTEFYYAHLSQDNSVYQHNGIFLVNNADRVRIDDQWPNNPPAEIMDDTDWHDVRIVRCANGDIGVYIDDMTTPLMTANDTTFLVGQVGFGSFDNQGRMRGLIVRGVESSGGSGSAELAVSSVSASAHDGNVPANTLDNNLTTRWSANGSGQWIEFDLGSSKSVDRLDIAWYKGNERVATFDIQYYDGSQWVTILAGVQSSGTTLNLETHAFSMVNTRYIRVVGYGNSSNTWNSITETDIYGS